MKKIIYSFLLLSICFFSSCQDDQDEYIGSDTIITEDRDLSDFINIDNRSIINTNISYGESQSVRVTANDNIMDKVIIQVISNTLLLNLEDGNYKNVSIDVDIIIPEFTEVLTEGTGNITINAFENLEDVTIESVGTGNITAAGSVDDLKIELTGTGNFNGFDFITKTTDANLTGTGNLEIYCSDELKGSITGTGSIYYKGNPSITVSVTGTGSIINAN